MKIFYTILDIVFPKKCTSCGTKGSDLCATCLSRFPETERECAKWIYPIFDYRHAPTKKSIRDLKYKNKIGLAKIFAEPLYEKIIEELSELILFENFSNPILIPIPLSKKRLRERGYNQALLLCKEIIKIESKNYLQFNTEAEENVRMKLEKNILTKKKETEHQASIKEKQKRLENLSNSFSVKNAALIKNRNIILIDDVVTTGATLIEARKELKKAGARKIIAFTIAH